MILVTAAYGKVAGYMIPQLLENGLEIRALDINPDVVKLKEIGVKETVCVDITSSGKLKEAMDGCRKILYIPPLALYTETKMAEITIDAAVQCNIEQFVMMSVTHPQMSTLLQHTMKLKAEEYLIYTGLSKGLNYTILQPMHYNHNFNVKMVMETGVYQPFYDINTRLSTVDCSDVGRVCAKILTEENHRNATYELCGNDYLSPVELVNIFNDVTGSSAKAEEIDVEELCDIAHITDSYGRECMRALSYTYGTYGIAGNGNVLEWLLGRKPTTFREFVECELMRITG